MTIDLDAVECRYMAALDAKPGKGPITRLDALTDCVADVGDLVDEVRELRARLASAAAAASLCFQQDHVGALLQLAEVDHRPSFADGYQRALDDLMAAVTPQPKPLGPRP